MESKTEMYRTAAVKLKDVRTAINAYNMFAMGNYLYVIGFSCYPGLGNPGSSNEVSMAESGIPNEILYEVYKK